MESAMAFAAPSAMARGVAPAADVALAASAPRAAAQLAEARAAAAGGARSACRATAAAALGGLVVAAARGRRRGRALARRLQATSPLQAPGAKSEEYLLLTVIAEDGTKIPVEARPMDTVKVVKAMVELEIGVGKEDQQLLLGDRRLPENATLSEMGIEKDLELKLVIIKVADVVDAEDDEVAEDCVRVIVKCQTTSGKYKDVKLDILRTDATEVAKDRALEKLKTWDENLEGLAGKDFGLFIPQESVGYMERPDNKQSLRPMKKKERLKDSATLEENGVSRDGPPQEVHLVHLFWTEPF